jgi:DNA-binding NarL/FixJ family response regulator
VTRVPDGADRDPRQQGADEGSGPLRVLIVDDHTHFREVARQTLGSAGFDVIGEAADGADALRLVRALCPQLVILDIQLPDTDGFHVAHLLSQLPEPPVVVMVSSRSESDYGGLVARSTARGFLTKTELTGAHLYALLADLRDPL